jgi:hypothetical protein
MLTKGTHLQTQPLNSPPPARGLRAGVTRQLRNQRARTAGHSHDAGQCERRAHGSSLGAGAISFGVWAGVLRQHAVLSRTDRRAAGTRSDSCCRASCQRSSSWSRGSWRRPLPIGRGAHVSAATRTQMIRRALALALLGFAFAASDDSCPGRRPVDLPRQVGIRACRAQ